MHIYKAVAQQLYDASLSLGLRMNKFGVMGVFSDITNYIVGNVGKEGLDGESNMFIWNILYPSVREEASTKQTFIRR